MFKKICKWYLSHRLNKIVKHLDKVEARITANRLYDWKRYKDMLMQRDIFRDEISRINKLIEDL